MTGQTGFMKTVWFSGLLLYILLRLRFLCLECEGSLKDNFTIHVTSSRVMRSSAAAAFSCQTRPWLCSRLLPSRFAEFLMALCEQITVFSSDQTATFFWWGVFLFPPPPTLHCCLRAAGRAGWQQGFDQIGWNINDPCGGSRAHTTHTHTLTVHINQSGFEQSDVFEGRMHANRQLTIPTQRRINTSKLPAGGFVRVCGTVRWLLLW